MHTWKQKAYDLIQKRAEVLKEAEAAFDAGEEETYTAKRADVEKLNSAIAAAKAMDEESRKDFGLQLPTSDPDASKSKGHSAEKFATAIKSMLIGKALTEGTDSKGGYTVPEDVDYKIHQYRDKMVSLIDYVSAATTTAGSGSMIFESRDDDTGFTEVDETGAAVEEEGPTLTTVAWRAKRYRGILPVSNDLIDDSAENIEAYITDWAGRKSRATENKIILGILKGKAPVDVKSLDDIKHEVNISLGPTFAPSSHILTNASGIDYLDRLTDNNGRPLLNPDPTAPSGQQLRIGFSVLPVIAVQDKLLPNVSDKYPFIVGDFADAVMFKARKGLTILPTKVGSVGNVNAFTQDMTLFRFIKRECAVKVDDKAWVYLLLDPKSTAADSSSSSDTKENGGT